MTLALLPDAEKLVGGWLRDHDAIAALGARVVGKTPSNTATAWVRLTLLDASDNPRSGREHLIGYLLQLDCYAGRGGGQPEANTLGGTARAVLKAMEAVTLDGGDLDGLVVTSVQITGHIRVPDTDIDEPARERVIITALVHGRRA